MKYISTGKWVVLCQVGDMEYILDGRVFNSEEAAVNANEAAGWPGTSVELFYGR